VTAGYETTGKVVGVLDFAANDGVVPRVRVLVGEKADLHDWWL
jgi:hypothetical protein